MILEICCFSYEGCMTALKGGANRIELCSNPAEGGTTPSYGFIKKVRETVPLKLYPLLRPRGGDFFYTQEEFEIILEDIRLCKELKCDGIATGVQAKDGKIDTARMKQIVDAAWPMGVTCIRAFDIVPDPFETIDILVNAGCERILTSGMASVASEASELLGKMIRYAADRIIIMPGSGIRPENISKLIQHTRAKEYHASARVIIPPRSVWHSQHITPDDFGNTIGCDLQQIQEMRKILNTLG